MSERYSRQALLSWIGPDGQRQIAASSAAVVGLGALGCTSASLLARAGVRRLLLVDRDFVEESNLPRQILYTESDAVQRLPKAVAAAAHLGEARSDLVVEALISDLDPVLARRLFAECSVVLDGTDNFETRYLLNDASVESGTPWVYAGAVGETGSVMTVLPGSPLACAVSSRSFHRLARHPPAKRWGYWHLPLPLPHRSSPGNPSKSSRGAPIFAYGACCPSISSREPFPASPTPELPSAPAVN